MPNAPNAYIFYDSNSNRILLMNKVLQKRGGRRKMRATAEDYERVYK